MFLQELVTYRYRNLCDQRIAFSDGVNFIAGDNAQGKSNLLEAIYMLGHGKSFRPGLIKDLIHYDSQEASLFGRVTRDSTELTLGVVLRAGRRSFEVNEKPESKLFRFIAHFPCYAFTPDDLQMVKSAPSFRRDFIDRALATERKGYLEILMSYQKVLRAKSTILKQDPIDHHALETLNDSLGEFGELLEKSRAIFCSDLSKRAALVHREFASDDGELSIGFLGCLKGRTFREELERIKGAEIAAARPLFGSQRDDYYIEIGAREARNYCSQGQCRSIVLSLVIAATQSIEEALSERVPLLLDDVESELDETRLKSFLAYLGLSQRQVFLTGTRKRSTEERRSFGENVMLFEVKNGEVFCDS